MKSKKDIRHSRNARKNQALAHLKELKDALQLLPSDIGYWGGDYGGFIADARNQVEQLTQCVHELSAYDNTLKPEA